MTEYAIIQSWDSKPDGPALFNDWLPGQIASTRELQTAEDVANSLNTQYGYPEKQQHLKFDVKVNDR